MKLKNRYIKYKNIIGRLDLNPYFITNRYKYNLVIMIDKKAFRFLSYCNTKKEAQEIIKENYKYL